MAKSLIDTYEVNKEFIIAVTLDVFPSPITCNSSISVTTCVHSASEYTGNVTFATYQPSCQDLKLNWHQRLS